MADQQRLRHLWQLYMKHEATDSEEAELLQLLAQPHHEALVKSWLDEYWDTFTPRYTVSDQKADALMQKIVQHQARVVSMRPAKKYRFTKWVAAAAILLLVSTGTFVWLNKDKLSDRGNTVKVTMQDVKAPGKTNAIITLANGQQIILDSAGNGMLAIQGTAQITKLAGGEVQYDNSDPLTSNSSPLTYNTLTNPRGSKVVTIILADGSKVWMNAESSLRYPVAFVGKERRVEVTGEAYFEVAKDAAKPFQVAIEGRGEVEVLGTHFNVNAYTDEALLKVTLLEGSVKLKSEAGTQQSEIIIKPGEQAIRTTDNKLQTTNNIDVEQVIAWKNGFFSFTNADIQTVMRQLERWYDVDVVYEGKIPDLSFGGEMQRDLNLSEVLKVLERSQVHFKIENRKIIVLP